MKCTNCHEEVEADQKFCNHCGASLDQTITEPATSRTRESTKNSFENIGNFLKNNLTLTITIFVIDLLVFLMNNNLGKLGFFVGIIILLVIFLQNNTSSQETVWNQRVDRQVRSLKNNSLYLKRFASYINVFAIFFLPFISLNKLASMGFGQNNQLLHLLPSLEASLFKVLDLLSLVSRFMPVSEQSGYNTLKVLVYIIIASSFVSVASLFIQKYSQLTLLISNSIPLVLYLIFYLQVPAGYRSYFASFIGAGFYILILSNIGLVVLSVLDIRKSLHNIISE